MLSKSARSTLLSMANNASQIKQTQFRMSSGRKFDSILDGGADYQKARGYQKSADELFGYKQNMDDGLSVIKSTISGVKSSKSMLQQLRSVAEDAQDGGLSEALAASRAGDIVSQYDNLVGDIGLQGVNLVNGSTGGGAVNSYDPALWEDITVDFMADVGGSEVDVRESFFYNEETFINVYDGSDYKLGSYDGTNWHDIAIDTGVSSFKVNQSYEYNGELFIRGEDRDASTSKLLKYDGTTWTDISTLPGYAVTDTTFMNIQGYNGELFLDLRDDGFENKLFVYDGSAWSNITSALGTSSFNSAQMYELNGQLIVHGFDSDSSSG
ncbi:MAG: flagellin, partial [Alphaproteobacteria bacterium]